MSLPATFIAKSPKRRTRALEIHSPRTQVLLFMRNDGLWPSQFHRRSLACNRTSRAGAFVSSMISLLDIFDNILGHVTFNFHPRWVLTSPIHSAGLSVALYQSALFLDPESGTRYQRMDRSSIRRFPWMHGFHIPGRYSCSS